MAKTIVGLFDEITHAHSAVKALQDAGFRREDIGLAANDATGEHARTYGAATVDATDKGDAMARGALSGAGVGAAVGGGTGLVLGLIGIGSLAIPGIGPIIAAGPIAAALAGAGIGAVTGGLIGGLTKLGVPEEHAHHFAEGVRRGGTLVTVKSEDADAEKAASIPQQVRRRRHRAPRRPVEAAGVEAVRAHGEALHARAGHGGARRVREDSGHRGAGPGGQARGRARRRPRLHARHRAAGEGERQPAARERHRRAPRGGPGRDGRGQRGDEGRHRRGPGQERRGGGREDGSRRRGGGRAQGREPARRGGQRDQEADRRHGRAARQGATRATRPGGGRTTSRRTPTAA